MSPSMSPSFESVNKSINGLFKNNTSLTITRVVFVVILVFMTSIPRSVLVIFENVFFQVFYLALMAYFALLDAPSALLMAAIYLFAIQQLNKSTPAKVANVNLNNINNNVLPHLQTLPTEAVVKMMNNKQEELLKTQQAALDDTMRVRKNMLDSQKGDLQDVMPDVMSMDNKNFKTQSMMLNNSDPIDFDLSPVPTSQVNEGFESPDTHPAYKTMTENIAAAANMFTTPQQFIDAQTNQIEKVNQTEGIKSNTNQITIQGLDLPRGFDYEDYIGAPVA
jgi:hypothetical protein